MALGEFLYSSDTLNQGRIKINNVFSGTSAIWSSSTGTDSVIRSNANEDLGNIATGLNSMAAGMLSTASGNHSIALWGSGNSASGLFSFVGGNNNTATTTYSTVIGGESNKASGSHSFIGGGDSNSATTSYSSIVGGIQNSVSGSRSFIGGGRLNSATTSYSCIVGGLANLITGSQSFVGGGYNNSTKGTNSFIGSGILNSITGNTSTIAGGSGNTLVGAYSFIGGGQNNYAPVTHSFIGGGQNHTGGGVHSFIGGGQNNITFGAYSSVIGGRGNAALHTHSIAAGGGSQTRAYFDFVLGGVDTITSSVNNNKIRLDGLDGNIKMDGAVSSPESDYSEYFEFEDGNLNNEDRRGYFVSLVDGKIKIGNENTIGIISVSPTIIGDSAPNHWSGMNVKDIWGVNIKEEYKIYKIDNKKIFVDTQNNKFLEYPNPSHPKGIQFDGLIPEDIQYTTEKYNKINPDFNSSILYLDRSERKEWAPVGLLGKLHVRTAEIITSKFINVNSNGMAINGTTYPVLSTIRQYNENQYGIVRVFFK